MVCDAPSPIRRIAAKKQGLKFYYTGRECKRGHVALRYTTTGHCLACHIPGIPGNPIGARMRAAYVPKKCENCDNKIPYDKRYRDYCSHKCANQAMFYKRGGLACDKACGECGASFHAKPAERYCSVSCKAAAKSRWMAAPRRYLQRLISLRSKGRLSAKFASSLTLDDLLRLLDAQGGKCALSGEAMTFHVGRGRVQTNCSIDRIDSAGDYALENVQLVCVAVNIMKHNIPESEFVGWCGKIASRGV